MMGRSLKEFYERVSAADSAQENIAFTVLSAEAAWEKGIITNGKLVWSADSSGFLRSHEEEVSEIRETGIHMIGGSRVFTEVIGHEKKLVICGAGHVSIPVIRIGIMLGFSVTVIDDRTSFAENAGREGADVICDEFEHALAGIPGSPDTYYVIVTRGHRRDRDCLRAIARKPHAYIGLMGSRRRVGIVLEGLREEGIPAEALDRVHTPIGLRIGAETPEEIAVSIMAEIIKVRNGGRRVSGFSKEMLHAILASGESEGGKVRQVMATIISRRGSAPREVGTKMLILKTGTCIGTIGGGLAEAIIEEEGRRMIRDGQREPKILYVDLTMESAEDEAMVCGGRIEVLMEPIPD